MKIMNYMNLNRHPVKLSFARDRTHEFVEIFHAHQGMELLYVHEGHGSVIVNQQIVKLAPGSLVYFRPYQLHRIQMKVSEETPYIRSLFVFEPSELDRYLAPFASLQSFFHWLWKDPIAYQVFSDLPQQHILQLLDLYRTRIGKASPEELLEEEMLFLVALLHELKAHWNPEESARPVRIKSTSAEQVMEWIEEHYMEEFHLESLAKAVHLSPNHISAVFRQTAGTSITEYLTARRIRQACWLLKTSDLTVQEVGHSIGLSNFPYFCQLFKKHVGLSPYRYKRSFD
ncbi:AraC family transcriptional regulator [Paenibacillus sp. RC67]|uniref:AraC family transcriptional regulator n=1 Tax=Paenibacillus sp. RC67 TaxID=3039392 RepID=UPI0024AE4971|nr:AraC family transcriptional regulator [Paenibacillus sp. RC67]